MNLDGAKVDFENSAKISVHRKQSSHQFSNRTRLIILVSSMTCLTTVYSNSLGLNFTVICMHDVVHEQSAPGEGEDSKKKPAFLKFSDFIKLNL